MKIETVNAPIVQSQKTTNNSSARDAAIKAIMEGAPKEAQVKADTVTLDHTIGQNTNVEEESSPELEASEAPLEQPAAEETKAVELSESEESISSQYAILARKQKQFRERERRIQARELALRASDEAKAAPAKPTFDESKYISRDRIAQDPLNALADLGISYDQITNLMLNQSNPQQIQQDAYLRKLEAKLAELEEGQKKTLKTYEEGQIQAREQAVKQIQSDVTKLVAKNPDFEMIKLTNSAAEVVKLIETTFDEDGTLLSIEEAAEQVENELLERQFRVTSNSNKIKQRLQSAASKPTETKQPVNQVKQPLRTLTNNVTSTRKLTAVERAMEAFKNPNKS